MSDLTERLRAMCIHRGQPIDELTNEAADTIDAQDARIKELEAELDRRDRQDKFNRGVKDGWPHD